ncbi:MAG: DUF512 domain-containing protein [Fusicatenibacter sp.]|nr:DUF512 domain-containing protein [Lachnospiraceae bacterium]MDY2936799.1 DUF512 domain-containing protein [Fusicatenibacter sp.]
MNAKKEKRHLIREVTPGSIADEMGLEAGDELLSINGEEIEDVFDYHYQVNDTYLELGIRKQDGEEWILEIDKEYDEDMGIVFENEFMDQYRSCRNNCIFCFIDQMPPGMRETLYFKDDDSRLSFLQGNYVTLTNMSDHDIDRIIKYHLAPINISFQTTNPELRCRMLKNRFAGDIFPKVKRLYDAGIEMNGQIVLCKGYNDGDELERSISDLSAYLPHLKSVSVVPVGLSKYRDGLTHLEPFEKEDAKEVLQIIRKWQKKLYEKWGLHFIHASDEWYLLAKEPLPEEEEYDGYLQLENGVGMLRLLQEEVKEELSGRSGDERICRISIATGRLAAPFLEKCMGWIREKYPNVKGNVYAITNNFFGESITVSGLITGGDLIEQLKTKDLGDYLLIPCNMLRSGENVFLDDVTVEEAEKRLNVKIQVVDEPGSDLVKAVLEEQKETTHRRRMMYEQADGSNCGQT